MYLSTWKQIANFFDVHQRTVKRWHYEIMPLPIIKTNEANQSRVMISKEDAEDWLKNLRSKLRHATMLPYPPESHL